VITRRKLLQGMATFGLTSFGLGGYALGIEPLVRLNVTRYQVSPADWPPELRLRIAVIADLHACDPWMMPERIGEIAERTNALSPDLILLLGDYVSAHRFILAPLPYEAWAEALAVCRAPLGVHAVIGNHDWWDDKHAMATEKGPVLARRALEKVGIPVYENDAVRLSKDGKAFWLAGLADQIAFHWRRRRRGGPTLDDLPGTLAQVTDDAPVILLAHEPDVFAGLTQRVSLTLAGHTHGGQVRVLGYAPVVPSRYRNRYDYGHVVEGGRHLIVSGGLGCSVAPVRFGMPPEIVLVEAGA